MAKITFTAAFKRHNSEKITYIPNALNHKGYLVRIAEEGRGKAIEKGGMHDGEGYTWTEYERYESVMKPYFDGQRTIKDGVDIKIKNSTASHSFEDAIKLGYEKYLLKFENNDTYEIWNSDEKKYNEFLEAKKVYFALHECWETGIIWHQLSTYKGRYPETVFNAMRPFLQYHDEQIEEEGDWKGWAVTDLEKLTAALSKIGWTVA